MDRRCFITIAALGITLAASAAARPGIYEYFKAGTKRGHSGARLPQGPSHARQTEPAAPSRSAPGIAPWSEAWFSDSTSVRRRIGEMTDALTVPMIGQTYPLPRGGGFVCSRMESEGASGEGVLACVLHCSGPELGGRRQNWFYSSETSPSPTLDRVRWVMVAPTPALRASWWAFVRVVADSLSHVMGPAAWAAPDSSEATWSWRGYTTSMRLHGGAARIDSLELECVSERLAEGEGHAQRP